MRLLKDLMTPDDFKDDPYGELTNQMGHTLAGVLASVIFCLAYQSWAGEMPYRWLVLAVCGWPYIIVIEWWRQGWKPGDAWFDSLMWMCGVLGPLFGLREIEPGKLQATPETFFPLFLFWSVALMLRVKKRL